MYSRSCYRYRPAVFKGVHIIKVLIADDHPVIRAAVKMMLKGRFRTILEANNGVETVQMARENCPDLIVLDLTMPKLGGLEVLHRLNNPALSLRTLVYTALDPAFYSVRCMRNGALGFISKANDLEDLNKAISSVMSGYTCFPRLPSSSVNMDQVQYTELQLIEKLSDRELTIFQALARGLTNKEIAELMLLSHKTVSTYKTRLIGKLSVQSAVHLRDLAKRNHVI